MIVVGKDNPSETVGAPVRLLLINPRFPESFWSFRSAVRYILPGKRALNPPLGLATLAALCPPDWEVDIVDENIESIPLLPDTDIVGICGMGVQFGRQAELLSYYREQGYYVVAGGSYASLCPERFSDLADTVVAGEAEYIWPDFCRDYVAGTAAALYQEKGVVDITVSPTPRFDLLKLHHYTTASMQFSRGCPYRCEFCDIIVMFGRRPRTKTVAQIGRELDLLRKLGVNNVFFVDDNLIGNKAEAKALLAYIRDYQVKNDYRFSFGTEASLNLAEDDELMRLFREAHFGWVFIGIESPDEASLREMKKSQNLRRDLLESVRTLYKNGIDVMAGFIVGFDNDTLATFERQRRFILESGIQVAMVGLLTALPRTPLFLRLSKEGRLIRDAQDGDNTRAATNIIPLRMGYDEMVAKYKSLYRELQSDAGIARRILAKMSYLGKPIHRVQYTAKERISILSRLLIKCIIPGGPGRMGWFLKTLLSTKIALWPQLITDWIAGLSMRDYVDRHFSTSPGHDSELLSRTLDHLVHLGHQDLRKGTLDLSTTLESGCRNLALTVKGHINAAFLKQAGTRLQELLRCSPMTVTLRIEALGREQSRQLGKLLSRLSHYGDRVFIYLHDNLRSQIQIDSSVFNLMLSTRDGVLSGQRAF